MYLFGFPEGLAGGSKETSYDTVRATFDSTNLISSYETQYQTSKGTAWNTNRNTFRTTSRSTTRSIPSYNDMALNVARRSSMEPRIIALSSNPAGTAPHYWQMYFSIGFKSDRTRFYKMVAQYFSNAHPSKASYPNGIVRGYDGFEGNQMFTGSQAITNHNVDLTGQSLNGLTFNIGLMGNAQLEFSNGSNNQYSVILRSSPASTCPYFIVDVSNISSVNQASNTSWSTSLGITNYQTSATTSWNTAHNTMLDTTFDTHYQTTYPTSHITYG